MKRIALSGLVFVLLSLPMVGISLQAPRAQFVAPVFNTRNGLYKIEFTADSMQRQDRVIHFQGHVEVWRISVSGRPLPVFQAFEATYNLDTPGEVEIPSLGHFTFGEKQ
jgi:hypothetical protein